MGSTRTMDSSCRYQEFRTSRAWRSLQLGGLTALLVGCATGARPSASFPSTGNQALDYYPLLSGWGWAMEIERDGDKVLAPYAVVEHTADSAVVKNGDERIVYAVSPEGLARRDGTVVGDFVLRTPVRKGTSWSVQGGEATIVDVGVQVTLPSDSYRDCAVVEEVRRDPSRVTRTTYCRGTGPVDIEVRVFDPWKKSFETMAHARLLSVTRPEPNP
jgi:hypothetical protein